MGDIDDLRRGLVAEYGSFESAGRIPLIPSAGRYFDLILDGANGFSATCQVRILRSGSPFLALATPRGRTCLNPCTRVLLKWLQGAPATMPRMQRSTPGRGASPRTADRRYACRSGGASMEGEAGP